MKLYEINQQIRDLLEQTDDDGCLPESALDELVGLNQARELKLEAIACIIKEKKATANELKAEEQQLAKRRKTLENDIDRMEQYLDNNLGGEKFETARCVVSYRKSEAVVIDDEKKLLPYRKYWVTPEPTLSKKLLGEDIKSGTEIPGAHIETRRNLQIR